MAKLTYAIDLNTGSPTYGSGLSTGQGHHIVFEYTYESPSTAKFWLPGL